MDDDCLKRLNVFRLCQCLKWVGYGMVLMVLGLVAFSYYAVVVDYAPKVVSGNAASAVLAITVLLTLTGLVGLIVWSYFATLVTDPGSVPGGWHPFANDEQAGIVLQRMQAMELFDRRDPRRPRYCKKCTRWKPERSHHCSMTGRCVLKMDHFCIWVCNCVGLLNYKFFLLFLFYTFVGALVVVVVEIPEVVKFFTAPDFRGRPESFLALVMNSAFVLALAAFLIMHWQLLSSNCSTIEMYEKERVQPWPYDRGAVQNFKEVFGET